MRLTAAEVAGCPGCAGVKVFLNDLNVSSLINEFDTSENTVTFGNPCKLLNQDGDEICIAKGDKIVGRVHIEADPETLANMNALWARKRRQVCGELNITFGLPGSDAEIILKEEDCLAEVPSGVQFQGEMSGYMQRGCSQDYSSQEYQAAEPSLTPTESQMLRKRPPERS